LAAAFTLGLVQNSNLLAQTDYQQVIHTTTSGNRVFMEINMLNLQESLDSLFLNMSSIQAGGSGSSWSDVLAIQVQTSISIPSGFRGLES
jgi:hypothetical protein